MDNNNQNNYISPELPNPSPQMAGATPPIGGSGGKKKKTGLIIGLVAAAVLLITGIVVALIIITSGNEHDNNTDNNSDSQQDEVSEAVRIENSRTAGTVAEFNTICDVGSITNAADFEKPYKIAAFSQTSLDRTWAPVILDNEAEYSVNSDNHESTNVIACLSEAEGSATKSETCSFRSGGQSIDVDYYSVQYNLTVHEAKSGKKIKDLGKIDGPVGECPTEVSFSPGNPRIYATPNVAEVDAALARFAESN